MRAADAVGGLGFRVGFRVGRPRGLKTRLCVCVCFFLGGGGGGVRGLEFYGFQFLGAKGFGVEGQ